MEKYDDLYRRVQDDRETNGVAFTKVDKEHREEVSGRKRKHRNKDGNARQQLKICDDLGELLTAMDGGLMADV